VQTRIVVKESVVRKKQECRKWTPNCITWPKKESIWSEIYVYKDIPLVK